MRPGAADAAPAGFCLQVSTLFEEDASVFPLKRASGDLSPPPQEDVAQSAHLRTLGLCRISSAKAPPGAAARPAPADPRRTPPRKQRLLCLLCPLELPSRRLLDVHVRSHRAAGGFGCVCCSWKADSWEQMEPHWRSHSRRKGPEGEGRRSGRSGRSGKQQERKAAESTALRSQRLCPETAGQEDEQPAGR